MKRLFALSIAALSAAVSAATLAPVQLLNPAGSTAGQAIVSTGAGTPPAWGTVTAGSLAPIAANNVLANFTGASASPTGVLVPSCSASGNNLQYTSGTGFTCATGYAELASPTFSGTVTVPTLTVTGAGSIGGQLNVTGAIAPHQTNGIIGTTTNNNATAGSIGEYISSSSGSTAMTTATPNNLISLSLSGGDWDVQCVTQFNAGAGAAAAQYIVGPNTVSATFGTFDKSTLLTLPFTTQGTQNISSPVVRFSLASTTTTYCISQATFSGGTLAAVGFIRARRVR